jgi:hypothetical protein
VLDDDPDTTMLEVPPPVLDDDSSTWLTLATQPVMTKIPESTLNVTFDIFILINSVFDCLGQILIRQLLQEPLCWNHCFLRMVARDKNQLLRAHRLIAHKRRYRIVRQCRRDVYIQTHVPGEQISNQPCIHKTSWKLGDKIPACAGVIFAFRKGAFTDGRTRTRAECWW